MTEPMAVDATENTSSKPRKRKRASIADQFSPEERETRIIALRSEIEGLIRCYREVMGERLDLSSSSSAIAGLMEERHVSLSKLVNEIHAQVKGGDSGGGGLSVASVKSSVISMGQRVSYGVPNVDADVFEDETEEALWCWETRDLKLLPKSVRGMIKNRRTYRRKIHERIVAVSEMIAVLQKSESNQDYVQDLRKASERLGKILSEPDIRLLQQSMRQKNDSNRSDKEAKREHKQQMKQLERCKREAEKEKKRLDRELEKEKKQSEKELRRLQDEAEKEEKRREKEETEFQKNVRRQQEEAEKEQRRREKEEAEKKKQLSMQKQASIMERFLKRSKTSSACESDQSPAKSSSDLPLNMIDQMPEPVTQSLDYALSQNEDINAEDIRKSHLNSWRCLGREIRAKGKQHWGIRKKPKMEVIKELKLSTSKGLVNEELNIEKLNDGWGEAKVNGRITDTIGESPVASSQMHYRCKQLLQFDKSHRPAFYGIRPKNSQVIGPRHPLKKDPDLDYDVDSDEEWEEEEPGESLSDCDKDEEEDCIEEDNTKVDDEDDSEDDFFVPDGYLSENEGVQVDRKEFNNAVEDNQNSPSSKQESENEDICLLLRQQKHLHSLTEQALRKNQPLVIVNLMHEKASMLAAEELTGSAKVEHMCLQVLSMRPLPGLPSIEILTCDEPSEEIQDTSKSLRKDRKTTSVATAAVISESDVPLIVSTIQACSQSIDKVVESLKQKFPSVPKYLLRNKAREISDFVDNRWQVKKEILDKLGLSTTPEKGGGRRKSIVSFFSKRCLPPSKSGKGMNSPETSPQSSQKPAPVVEMQPVSATTLQEPLESAPSHHA